jgi:riboflavin synthase
MFTGIITAVGNVASRTQTEGGVELTIASPYEDLTLGESVAVDGACLTVQSRDPSEFTVHIIRTSLDRTNFDTYSVDRKVNLERALQVGARLGGHLVQGHVDGIGTVEQVREREDARLIDLRVPAEVAWISVPLGSVTVDGVSLTVNARPAPDLIQISLIPFTLQHTTLAERRPGDRVHLEADSIGKYVAELLRARGDLGAS